MRHSTIQKGKYKVEHPPVVDDPRFISPEQLVEAWKRHNFPPVPRDEKWHTFKTRVCKAGDPLNPILVASGGEIEVEQFGIIGWLNEIKAAETVNVQKPSGSGLITTFMQCSLVEARETGTGKFGEWLESVKAFCAKEYDTVFALHNITNQRLYKYCERHGVHVSDDVGMLYTVKLKDV